VPAFEPASGAAIDRLAERQHLSLSEAERAVTEALLASLGDLVVAFFGEGAAGIVEAGAEATQTSLQGQYSVGPLTFALAIGSVLLGLYVIAQYRDEEDTGNLIPGLPFDVPFIGEEEEDED